MNNRGYNGRYSNLNENIQNIIDTVIDEYLTIPQSRPIIPNTHPSQPRQNNNNTQGETYVEYVSLLQSLRDIMMGYNNGIRDYNQNIGICLQILLKIQQDLSRIREQTQPSAASNLETEQNEPTFDIRQPRVNIIPRNNATSRLRSTIPIPLQVNDTRTTRQAINRDSTTINNLASQIAGNLFTGRSDARTRNPLETTIHSAIYSYYPATQQSFQDVVVYPTQEQIDNATELVEYSNDGNTFFVNTNCPISLEDFQDGDDVQRILHCGHTFRRSAIQNWFSRNVRCPVCRYDIRDYVRHTQSIDASLSSGFSTENETGLVDLENDSDEESENEIPPLDISLNSRYNPDNFNNLLNEMTNTFTTLLQNYNQNPNNDIFYRIEVMPVYDISFNDEVD